MLVLSFNMVIFVFVIVVLVRHLRKRSKDHTKKGATLKLMLNITGVAFLFGLTWLFGAMTFVNRQNAFQILFALANSFQGFMIFIFFCVLNNDVRLAWVHLLVGKPLKQQKSIPAASTKLSTLCRGNHDMPESETVTVLTFGTLTNHVSTLNRTGQHMDEVVEVKFNDQGDSSYSDIPDPSSQSKSGV